MLLHTLYDFVENVIVALIRTKLGNRAAVEGWCVYGWKNIIIVMCILYRDTAIMLA